MKGFIIFLTAVFVGRVAFAREQPLLARVTVYWARGGNGSDHYTRQHQCATGLRLRAGHCAVDPRRVPYGSSVVLPDGSRLAAVDTGSAVRTRKAARQSGRTANERNAIVIDRFFETKGQALTWAKTHPMFMPIKVVSPGHAAPDPTAGQQRLVASNPGPPNQRPIFSSAVDAATATNQRLMASSSTMARNPLNKLGR